MRKQLFFYVFILLPAACFTQTKFWKFESGPADKLNLPQVSIPKEYKKLSLTFDDYKAFLKFAPKQSADNLKKGLEVSLPYPDNTYKRFKIVETPIMEEGLAAQFPDIRTFTGQGIDDPSATVSLDYTSQGFHALVLSQAGRLFIDPYQKGNNDLYISYFSNRDNDPVNQRICQTSQPVSQYSNALQLAAPLAGTCIGPQLKTYRTAISCTGEYAIAVCPVGNVTVANTMSAIVTTINRVDGVYQTELGIKLVLVAANASIVYTNPTTDPYTGNNDGTTLIGESQTNITSVLGSANFDVGHTFSTGGGGTATIGVVCNTSNKARGVTGVSNPTGDAFNIDYVAHEMAHQFGAYHSFESNTSSCNGNRSTSSAYEVGGGTTIMSYSGICGSDDIQPNSNPYFNSKSFDEIIAYTTTGSGLGCAVTTATGNQAPVVVMPANNLKIPLGTPFILTGYASDPDGDVLTYSWEEWDISNASTGSAWNSGATSTVAPLFKNRIPRLSPSRTFPDMSVILAGYPSNPPAVMNGLKGETLPQVARDIKFRLAVRDNKAGGGGVATGGSGCSSTAAFKVIVTNDGPFKLNVPNTAVNWLGGTTQTVTWDVANTNDPAGIDVQKVDIFMSADGGNTFPVTIVSNTSNDGSASIIVPNIPTNTTVRFMVKAAGNIFFDISDVNFTITVNVVLPVSLLSFSATPLAELISLDWATISEFNNKGFDILRSEGGSGNFIRIGFVPGARNSHDKLLYTYPDKEVQKGVQYYYKLRMIDADNNYTYSAIEAARIGGEIAFSMRLQPQPVYDVATLAIQRIQKSDFTVVVSDIAGRVVWKKDIRNKEDRINVPLDLKSRETGVYFIRLFQGPLSATLKAVKL